MGNTEMESRYAQVDLGRFFDDYMPQPATPLSARQLKKIGNFSSVPYLGTEEQMYGPLCETFRKLREAIKSPFTVYDTSGRIDREDKVKDMKPDLSLYDGTHGTAKYNVDVTERTSSKVTDKMRTEYLGRTSWAWMTSFIEVKSSPQWAPFNFDDTDNFDVKDTDLGKRSRAQVIKYVSQLQHRQHRKFVLCAFVWRDWVRFMRWDRAGAIVSTADNYVNNPQRLLDFIHRISTSPPEDHGYDPTVTLVKTPEPDIKKYVQEIKLTLSNEYLIKSFDEAFGDKTMDCGDYPLYELTCEDVPYRAEDREAASAANRERAPPAHRTNSYWISKIHAGSCSPIGRGTKGFIAIDIDHHQIVFLKDYWCPDLAGIHPELETYARLRGSNVPYVATALAGGTVIGSNGQAQVTVAQEGLKTMPRDQRVAVPPKAIHYRFVVREIGRPLEEYQPSSQLWNVLMGSIIGHQDAYEKAQVLHRDISVSNIMINPLNDRALLIDWDLAKYMDSDQGLKSNQSGRSGTWPFMSAKLLQLPKKPNDLADDLESFIYVLCVMVLCYHDHTLSPTNIVGDVKEFSPAGNARNIALSKYIDDTFYTNIVSGRYHFGGQWKLAQIVLGKPGFTPTDERLKTLIFDLYGLLHEHYKAFPVDDLREKWGVVVPAAPVIDDSRVILKDLYPDVKMWLLEVGLESAQPNPIEAGLLRAAPPDNTLLRNLCTHDDIYGVFLSDTIIKAHWPVRNDKTDSQFLHLPNANGTKGTEATSSLASRSAGGAKHSLDLEEEDMMGAPRNKKLKSDT